MTPFIAELLGTALIITIGDGVVANVVLPNTKGNNGGLISIVWLAACLRAGCAQPVCVDGGGGLSDVGRCTIIVGSMIM